MFAALAAFACGNAGAANEPASAAPASAPVQPPGITANPDTACVSMCGQLNNIDVPAARRVE